MTVGAPTVKSPPQRGEVLHFAEGFTVINDVYLRHWGYGWGYVAAIGISTLLSWTTLRQGLKSLSRHIFFVNSAVPASR